MNEQQEQILNSLIEHRTGGVLKDLSADDDAVAAGRGGDLLVIGRAARVGLVSTSGSSAVELDAVTSTGDTVTLARALGIAEVGERAGGRWGRGVGAAGEAGADGRWWRHGELVVVFINSGGAEAGGEFLNGGCAVVGGQDVLGRGWVDWLGRLDLGNGEWASLGDIGGEAGAFAAGFSSAGRGVLGGGGGLGRALGGRGLGRLLGWDIEDVQNTAGGGLGGGGLGWVVGDVVTINDIVIPVTLTSLEGGALESEGTLPRARLGGGLVLGKRKLTSIVIP